MPTPSEIAARGLKNIRVADRSHEYFSPEDLRKYNALVAADALDDTYAGMIPVRFDNPEDQ